MKIYHYDPLTRVFLFEDVAQPDPLEEGNFLVPAWATGKPPLAKVPEGKQCVFYNDEWVLWDLSLPQPEESNPLTDEEMITQTKSTAKKLLQDTDYTQVEDVLAVLVNVADFIEYRTKIRTIFLSPTKNPKWPAIPTPEWA